MAKWLDEQGKPSWSRPWGARVLVFAMLLTAFVLGVASKIAEQAPEQGAPLFHQITSIVFDFWTLAVIALVGGAVAGPRLIDNLAAIIGSIAKRRT